MEGQTAAAPLVSPVSSIGSSAATVADVALDSVSSFLSMPAASSNAARRWNILVSCVEVRKENFDSSTTGVSISFSFSVVLAAVAAFYLLEPYHSV